jgi:DNA-binding FadR family transcriptional regulator
MITKTLLKDKAVQEIIVLIAQTFYSNGQRLPSERELSTRFRISRGTLREALSKLERLGVLEIRASSGIYVKRFNRQQVGKHIIPERYPGVSLNDIIVARMAIELTAVQLACKNRTGEDIKKLQALLDHMERHAHDLAEFLKYDMEFHRSIIVAGSNKVLLVAFDAIQEYHRYSHIFVTERAPQHHLRILESLKRRDAVSARRYMRQHLDDMKPYLQQEEDTGGSV